MAATLQDIKRWVKEGQKQGATHLIVVCDTFDYDDYPVFVMPGERFHNTVVKYHNKNMQKIMEVYNLKKLIEPQLEKERNFEY